ncbi:bis(5'-nucleosyl)-tetraphosphatase [Phycisphaera mikurensis]|uniref:Bis(5'-nucleosyl)-tetraphosphatase [asymmetrical] n=1 Tax=Phycisphaera mikurensis (strain NBRC 102666 / KCTC 22515 / FYK2301M01) TaxID=1142394 RepID=I0IEA2_PHYMF|nr:NUDIX domain-containing protein [Phycisphaera mikurensis]MBB6441392.1 8-oxo-dGTP pyrophosphatase MutT (NUDIX family) [Phycisphaera mikurensis]BAM03590.1 putative hydrolase [Phycisphaera mikurensis NBRC 102666]
MRTDFSCGIIPVIHDGTFRRYLLVRHAAGHWSFPKGHPEVGESDLAAALRELAEETGVAGVDVLPEPVFPETYAFTKRSGRTVHKRVNYFLARVEPGATVRLQAEEVSDHAWGRCGDTSRRMTFGEGRKLLRAADAFIGRGGAASIGL